MLVVEIAKIKKHTENHLKGSNMVVSREGGKRESVLRLFHQMPPSGCNDFVKRVKQGKE